MVVEGQGSGRDRPCTPGNEEKLRCSFHGWAYNLDGSIHFLPGGSDFALSCVRQDEIRLREARLETWGGFLVINMAPAAEPLLDRLRAIPRRLARITLANRRTAPSPLRDLHRNL